jgi:hypothetical protein
VNNDETYITNVCIVHNCLCIVEQHDEDKELTPEEDKDSIVEAVTGRMDDTFKSNPGKDGVIFSDSHPYFDVSEKDREYAANNFNLPIPSIAEETLSNNINLDFGDSVSELQKKEVLNSIKESSLLFKDKLGVEFGDEINMGREHGNIDFVKSIKVINDKNLDTPFAEYLRSESSYGKADSLFINLGKQESTEFAENLREIIDGKTPMYNITSLTDAITHEAGHNFYFGHSYTQIKEFKKAFESTKMWKSAVSIYGQENPSEYFAESIVSLLRGDKKESVSIIKKYFKL